MKKVASLLFIISIAVGSVASAKTKPRKFYITQTEVTGGQALTACADGYHMASLWEIFEVSNLRYDTTLGFTQADSGFGPPARFSGWIRTGVSSFGTTGIAGVDNCLAWTSSNNSDLGTVVLLNSFWNNTTLITPISPWFAGNSSCGSDFPVWCVQDLKGK
jgi:hypothetical protein